ncbi:MAG: EamA family transporter [Pseudomonadota bacterium]
MITAASETPPLDTGGSRRPKKSGLLRALPRIFGATPPPVLVLLAILSIQLGAALAIDLFATFGPVGTAFLRIAISAVLLAALARPKLDGTLRKNLGLIVCYGIVLATMNACFYMSIARIPLGVAVTIEFLGPLGVAVAASRRPRDLLWVGLALAGVAILSPKIGGDLDPLGVLYAAIAGCMWALFVLISVRVGKTFEGGSGLALGMVVATLVLLPVSWASAGTLLTHPSLIIIVCAVALLSTTVPLALEFEALKRMPPRVYGVLITLEPAIATLVGAILLGDGLGWRSLLAVACVVLASIGATLFEKR